MAGRGGVRSSARLSAEPGPAGGGASPAAAGAAPGGTGRPGRPLATSGAAAARRARAVERALEVEDSPRELRDKCRRLARALRNAKHLVVYTGAGISTAADIPDYRGPHGVWTRLQRGEAVGRVEVSRARPTFTHMALTALWARGALKFVVSQNCDGLHLRAGLPRRALAELHGDMFAELCAPCRAVYLRAFDTTERTARHAHGSRRLCHACGAELRDSIVHFGERGRAAWPLNWAGALRHAARADVVLCLGSSLKVLRRYPRLWRMQAAPRQRPALYIVNLQWTPKDAVAALKINARCDAVMRLVARRLRLRVPRYRPGRDPLLAHAEPLAEPERHTTRRPLLPPPAPASDDSEPECPESPSASDSDEELPLRRLADRLRAPGSEPEAPSGRRPDPEREAPPGRRPDSEREASPRPGDRLGVPSEPPRPPCPPEPPPRPPTPPQGPLDASSRPSESPPCLPSPPPPTSEDSPRPPERPPRAPDPARLCTFRVSMAVGEATILLRPEHAPASPGGSPSRARTLDLRKFRMVRRGLVKNGPTTNGHGPPAAPFGPGEAPPPVNGAVGSKLRRLLEYVPHIDSVAVPKRSPGDDLRGDEEKVKGEYPPFLETESKGEWKTETKTEPESAKESDGSSDGEAGALAARSLAAAIIRRAVLLCRASLYPGLHTIVGAPRPPRPPRAPRPPPDAECAWCARHYAAPKCLWYGAPRHTPLGARAWRRARGRRYLCACCGAGAPADAPAPAPEAAHDTSGWYGKGYRKGRRRRR